MAAKILFELAKDKKIAAYSAPQGTKRNAQKKIRHKRRI
jgi:hypothetical protein